MDSTSDVTVLSTFGRDTRMHRTEGERTPGVFTMFRMVVVYRVCVRRPDWSWWPDIEFSGMKREAGIWVDCESTDVARMYNIG